MSKRTLILITFLTLLTAFFVYLAVSQNSTKPVVTKNAPVTPTKKPSQAFTTLALTPQKVVLTGKTGTIAVEVDTHGEKNKVTAVQLELKYDSSVVSNLSIQPGTFLEGAAPMINSIDAKTGRVTYALGISPTKSAKGGKGVVATITFQANLAAGRSTEITVLPTSIITAEGIAESVLLKSTSALITASSQTAPEGAMIMQKTPSITPTSAQ